MKKLLLLLCFVFISSASYSQFIAEDFDYPAGDSLGAHGWVSFSGGATNRLLVTSPGLTYTDYVGTGIGNATTVINSGQDAYISLTSDQSSGSVYTSMMVNVTTARTGDYFAAYLPSTSTTLFNGRLYVRNNGNGFYSFGISKTTAGSGGIFYGDSVFSTGTTYLLVLKYTFNIGSTTDDEITLYAFSGAVPSSEPGTAYVGPITGTATDIANIGRFALRQGTAASSPDLIVDGIYTEGSWNNAVLPVELSSFTSVINNRDVTLNWTTASELNNSGFDIERSSEFSSWTKIGNVTGNGTINTPVNYSFTDRGLATGNYSYRLKQIDFNGNYEYFNLSSEVNIGVPSAYKLSQNYPNPFNPATTISYDIPADGKVSLKLFDMSGKEVATLVNEVKTAGYYSVNFNAANLSSGIYFYELASGNFSSVKKMMLVK
ncbi:MAG TPA: T9SS type A sorting domain-containing protein [Ignavibacteria bacterium]|nr:T9SS type A sorting domain-containing protein [Ignavibacteria bacterium]HRJ99162.1 T9SS type A sorting domain-containing protein [Ignavibacteria bacterium]